MITAIERLPKSTIKLTVTVPQSGVQKTYNQVLVDIATQTKIEGFRVGKAPKELVEKRLDPNKLRTEVLNRILPQAYIEAIKEHNLKPIANPKVEIKQFAKEKDLVFEAITVERPEVKLGDYKEKLKAQGAKFKTIYGPNGKPVTQKAQKEIKSTKIETNEVLKIILNQAEAEVPNLLIEDEVNRMLTRLLDQLQRLGLTIEQYLSSKNQTAEQLRLKFKKTATDSLKLEFILDEIAKAEEIEVSEKEIEEAVNAAPDEKAREELAREEGRWYIKSVLKKRKTIKHLLEIAESVPGT